MSCETSKELIKKLNCNCADCKMCYQVIQVCQDQLIWIFGADKYYEWLKQSRQKNVEISLYGNKKANGK